MVTAVSYGMYVAIALMAAWVCREWTGRRGRFLLWALLPLLGTGVLLSFTRSVWLGAAAGAFILLALALRGPQRRLILATVAAAGLLAALIGADALKGLRREDSEADSRRSVSMRASFAYVSWQMFLDRPLLGFGFGQFPAAKLAYLDDRNLTDLNLESIRDYVHHNTFFSVLTETGLLGLAL